MMRPNPDRRSLHGRLPTLLCFLALTAAVSILTSSARAVTLDGAVRSALADNLDLRAARFEVEKARGRLIQAGLWPNPSVEFGFRSDALGNSEGERTVSAGFVQTFPITGRLKFARQVSRVDVAQAMVEIRNRERLLIGEVQRDYLTVLLLQRQIAANREFIGVNRDFVTLFEQRLAKAEVSEVDVNLSRVELQRVELETAVLGADLSSRELALKQRLGIGPAGRLEVEGDVEALAGKFRPEKYRTTMVVNRPDLRLIELSVDRAQAEIRLARAEAWQDWSVGLDYENDRSTDDPNGLGTNNFSGLKFSIPLALWNRNQGRVHEQQATADQAHQQIEALRLSIRTEIATSIAQAMKLREVVGTYQKTLLPTLASTTDLLKKGLKEGLTDASRLVQAQQQRATLRASYLTAYTSYVQALVELETASGGSPFLSKDFLIERNAPSKNSSSYRK
jgi:cobalt-zinc-cadmium efflux system outer membrane protein